MALNAVAAAILAATTDAKLRAAMLMGSRLESGQNVNAVGDNGSSFGPFQIHLPAHPGVSAAEAQNPQWAVHYMLPSYQAGVARVPATLWASDPAQAAATAAFYAERPAKMYSAANYNADWKIVSQELNGQGVGAASGFTPLGGADAAGSGLGSTPAATSASIFNESDWERNISDVLNYLYMGLIVAGGLVIMTVGLFMLMRVGADTIPNLSTPIRPRKVVIKNVRAKVTNSTPRGGRPPKPYRDAGATTQSASTATSRTAIGSAATTTAGKPATLTRVSPRPGRPIPGTVKVVKALPPGSNS